MYSVIIARYTSLDLKEILGIVSSSLLFHRDQRTVMLGDLPKPCSVKLAIGLGSNSFAQFLALSSLSLTRMLSQAPLPPSSCLQTPATSGKRQPHSVPPRPKLRTEVTSPLSLPDLDVTPSWPRRLTLHSYHK